MCRWMRCNSWLFSCLTIFKVNFFLHLEQTDNAHLLYEFYLSIGQQFVKRWQTFPNLTTLITCSMTNYASFFLLQIIESENDEIYLKCFSIVMNAWNLIETMISLWYIGWLETLRNVFFFFVMSLAAVGILVYTFDLISSDMIRCILQLQHRLSHDCTRFNWEYLVKWVAADVDNVSNRLISSHSNHVASHLKISSSEWRGMIVNDVSMNKQ